MAKLEVAFSPDLYPFYENNEERISIAGNLGVIEVNN